MTVPAAGQQFGNYRVIRLLGMGGSAEVYLAEHIYLNTQAAIKVLRTRLGQAEEDNFLREARTIARLLHPNIIRVLDFGMQDSLPFLVMDYAPNGSLRDRHPHGTQVPLATINSYVQQVASALQYAHDQKLVHRDIKPENMLIGRHDEVLLGDFGISLIAQTSQVQKTQEVAGTIPYMAPEQIQGKPRPASDQYALAVVVYEWLTGTRPFRGSFTELYGQHLFTPPPPLREKRPDISPDIESVVMTALAKDPHQRFASIRAFATALSQAIQQTHQTTTEGVSSSEHSSNQIYVTVTQPQTEQHIAAAQTVQQTPPIIQSPTPSKRGPRLSRRAALIGIASGAGLLAIGGGALFVLTRPTPLPPRGTIIQTYSRHAQDVLALSWHDNTIASAAADDTVQVWDATTGEAKSVYRPSPEKHTTYSSVKVRYALWSPDGQYLAIGGSDNVVHIWDGHSEKATYQFTKHKASSFGAGIGALAWSPDSLSIASGADDSVIYIWDAKTGAIKTTYKGHIPTYGNSSIKAIAWSPDGKLIASSSSLNSEVRIWEPGGKDVFEYDGQSGSKNAILWLPDGEKLMSATSYEVKLWDRLAGAEIRTFADEKQPNIHQAVLSPDGRYLATAHDKGLVRVWEVATGKKIYDYTFHDKEKDVIAVAWANDSRRLASGGNDAKVIVWVAV